MRPNISEFSYGFALTNELVHVLPGVTAAPIFPSLYQEGQVGGGYDVILNSAFAPLFVQFKLSHCMTHGTAAEARAGLLTCPFYRMHIRPSRHSRQHQLLLDLENAGECVYYAAPVFHEPEEFNEAFLARTVVSRSIWVTPSAIGSLPDEADHHVAFSRTGDAYFCSTPSQMREPIRSNAMITRLLNAISKAEKSRDDIAVQIDRIIDIMTRTSTDQLTQSAAPKLLPRDDFGSRHPLDRLALFAQRDLDAQVYLLRRSGA